jgi:hypothetical protein
MIQGKMFFLGKGITQENVCGAKKGGNSVGRWGKHMLNKSLGVGPMWKKGRRGTRSGGNFWGGGVWKKVVRGKM